MQVIENKHQLNWICVIYQFRVAFVMVPFPSLLPHPMTKTQQKKTSSNQVHLWNGRGAPNWGSWYTLVCWGNSGDIARCRKNGAARDMFNFGNLWDLSCPYGIWVAPMGFELPPISPPSSICIFLDRFVFFPVFLSRLYTKKSKISTWGDSVSKPNAYILQLPPRSGCNRSPPERLLKHF